MLAFDRVRYLPYGWRTLAEVLIGPAGEWLPQPLTMTGVHEFSGVLRVVGMQVEVDYVVPAAWRDGREVSRGAKVLPKDLLFAGANGELCLKAEREDLTQVRFVGSRVPARALVARPLGPVTSSLLVTRFVDHVLSRLDRACLRAQFGGHVEDANGRS